MIATEYIKAKLLGIGLIKSTDKKISKILKTTQNNDAKEKRTTKEHEKER